MAAVTSTHLRRAIIVIEERGAKVVPQHSAGTERARRRVDRETGDERARGARRWSSDVVCMCDTDRAQLEPLNSTGCFRHP